MQLFDMSELSDDDLRTLAIDAVHDVAGNNITFDIEIANDRMSTDYPSCFFSIRIGDDYVPSGSAGLFWIKILDALHERLTAAGDPRYPHFGRFGFYPLFQLERA
jgi:hypothetical protein